ncbi:MAG: 4a-hydroxytetrahydrobiopterin dehydratase [Francisellaceae bacterium]|jgi:4a-hydroxytetrahydrobiopterin dehydratase|nr:4a-hydroxytetrahydrobiopterin dehydratase [Francisellaceae bacterium]MBT6206690.1 4a-hydroxytetrahydrobiopterin dehydratase [Francisellaceae bacterium]MBT6538771.1 4a-hydroxytetrahydrobiopterin dehydratase [Francisellaceae bacterium]
MSELTEKKCEACESWVAPMASELANDFLGKLESGWQLSTDGKTITKEYKFKNYYRTMAFVNAIAWMANGEGHHPDLEVSYNRCVINYTTHAIKGLSENDFICAAKADEILKYGP